MSKIRILVVLLGLLCLRAVAAENVMARTQQWNLMVPMYGQFRIVPAQGMVDRRHQSNKNWSGPWKQWDSFAIQFTSQPCQQLEPEKFDFIMVMITLEGQKDQSNREAAGSSVALWDGTSRPEDVKIELSPLPADMKTGKEYHVASLRRAQENAPKLWDVYVRFDSEKPAYIKEKSSEAR